MAELTKFGRMAYRLAMAEAERDEALAAVSRVREALDAETPIAYPPDWCDGWGQAMGTIERALDGDHE